MTQPLLIQNLESLTFGFIIKKTFFYLLQLPQNSLYVQGIIPYTVIKLIDFFFPCAPVFTCWSKLVSEFQKVNFQLMEVTAPTATKQKSSPGILSVEWLLKSQGSLSLAEGRHSLSGCKCTVVHRVKRNNLEIVMIKAEFGLLDCFSSFRGNIDLWKAKNNFWDFEGIGAVLVLSWYHGPVGARHKFFWTVRGGRLVRHVELSFVITICLSANCWTWRKKKEKTIIILKAWLKIVKFCC